MQGLENILDEALEEEESGADPAPESTPTEEANVETADEEQTAP